MSRVDVIIPCYKYGNFLRGCAESVLNQPVDVRVLILDDASPDNTADVAAELAAQDTRVEYRRHTVNQGHIATYNEGLEWVTGDYVLLISADDRPAPGALLRAARLLDAHPDVGFVYGRAIRFSTGEPLPEPGMIAAECAWQIQDGITWLEALCKDGANCIHSPEVITRACLQRKLGGYREELPHTGDMEMWMRFAAHAAVGILDADQAFYRVHGQNMHIHQFATALADLRQRHGAFETVFREKRDHIREWQRLQDLANRTLARDALWIACKAFDNGGLESARISDLVHFARGIYQGARSLPEYSGLHWRLRLGPRIFPVLHRIAARKSFALAPL